MLTASELQLLVLIMRTACLSQAEVAEALNIKESRVKEIESWASDQSNQQQVALINNTAIDKVVREHLPYLVLEERELALIRKTTAVEVIKRYHTR